MFINQNKKHYNQHISANEKLVYYCSIKTYALRFDEVLDSFFCILLIVEAFSVQKVVKILKEVVVSWTEVTWILHLRQKL